MVRKTLTAFKMAKRILENTNNIYNKKTINRQVITDILKLYMEECHKALLKGERIEITGVGTIVPEVKVHIGNYNLPMCNKEGMNPPFTKLRITRIESLRKAMNKTLTENIENGIYGLEELPFSKQQLTILKDNGYIKEDTETEEVEKE